jgi:hypothetical protein
LACAKNGQQPSRFWKGFLAAENYGFSDRFKNERFRTRLDGRYAAIGGIRQA